MEIKFGTSPVLGLSLEETIQNAQRLESLGFDTAWQADHLVTLNRRNRCLDPWPIMATLSSHTKNIRFGSMVTDPFRRHPAVFAQTLATIDWITGGRLILGIAAGEAMNVVPFNIPWDHRAKRLEESVRIMKMLWKGESVDFQGEFFKLDKAFIQALPIQKEGVPVYIGANSPLTRRLAGRLGDGWIAEMMSPEMYKHDLSEIRQVAEGVGRTLGEFDVVYHVFCAVSKNRLEAKTQASRSIRMQFTWWPKQLERYGYKISDHCDWNQIVVDEGSSVASQELSKGVPEKIADLVTISGNADECISKIEEYVKSGVTHFGLAISGNRDETLKAFGEEIIPYFKK